MREIQPVSAFRSRITSPSHVDICSSKVERILDGLPGADLIVRGLADHARGVRSAEACLVEMASPRLVKSGLLHEASPARDSEIALYRILGSEVRDPYPAYNALRRRLVSFQRALDQRMRKVVPPTGEILP